MMFKHHGFQMVNYYELEKLLYLLSSVGVLYWNIIKFCLSCTLHKNILVGSSKKRIFINNTCFLTSEVHTFYNNSSEFPFGLKIIVKLKTKYYLSVVKKESGKQLSIKSKLASAFYDVMRQYTFLVLALTYTHPTCTFRTK